MQKLQTSAIKKRTCKTTEKTLKPIDIINITQLHQELSVIKFIRNDKRPRSQKNAKNASVHNKNRVKIQKKSSHNCKRSGNLVKFFF